MDCQGEEVIPMPCAGHGANKFLNVAADRAKGIKKSVFPGFVVSGAIDDAGGSRGGRGAGALR